MMSIRLFIVLISCYYLNTNLVSGSACVNNCNRNGICDSSGVCNCFDGYSGIDCAKRNCPTGRRLSDIPTDFDTAHAKEECSGQGTCIIGGVCECDANFAGPACDRLTCFNSCSQHGECLSLKQAAEYNDGYLYNRSTTYTQWDAGIIYGCKCDAGWTGFDCSERTCEYGVDPRLHDSQHETVILKVFCPSSGCVGSFKLRAFGVPMTKWVNANTLNTVLQDQLMVAGRTYTDNAAHSSLPIQLFDQDGCNGCALGVAGKYTYTSIKFLRQAGHVPAISIYANLMTSGTVSFETTQILSCDCSNNYCHGTFRVAYDGVIGAGSTNINPHSDNGALVVSTLNALETMTNAGISVKRDTTENSAICVTGLVNNHTFVFNGPLGNMPIMEIWSSIVATPQANPATFSSEDSDPAYPYSSGVLHVYSPQTGRNDALKICSGIGTCNYETASCECPEGWVTDADSGPCSKLSPATSEYDGLQTCPGLVWTDRPTVPVLERDVLKSQRMYVSVNHVTNTYFGPTRSMLSSIEYFDWDPDTMVFNLGRVGNFDNQPILNLTTDASAGPLVADKVMNRLYFVDNNVAAPFIGYFNMNSTDGSYFTLTTTTGVVSSLIFDVHFKRRRLYWSITGTANVADGEIYYTIVDNNAEGVIATVYSLVSVIGQSNLIDPTGIALHYTERKLYWLDIDQATDTVGVVLRSISLPDDIVDITVSRNSQSLNNAYYGVNTGTPILSVKNPTDGTDMPVSTTSSDSLLLLLNANNTAVFADVGSDVKIIGGNLDEPLNATDTVSPTGVNAAIFSGYYRSKILLNTTYGEIPSLTPRYFTYDTHRKLIVWSDPGGEGIFIARYPYRIDEPLEKDPLRTRLIWVNPANAVSYPSSVNTSLIFPKLPVGIYLDKGSFSSTFESTTECYGNGNCRGLAGNWLCDCYEGSVSETSQGNCSPKTKDCPMGLAWYNKPVVNERAHDEVMECSNMGKCNRNTGECICRTGFEGAACERLSCPGESPLSGRTDDLAPTSGSVPCSNAGRCLSMRNLARYTKNSQLEYRSNPNSLPVIPQTDATGASTATLGTISSYGYIPNKATTWDADRIQGCLADEYGFTPDHNTNAGVSVATTSEYNAAAHTVAKNQTAAIGYDLSHRACPFGYSSQYIKYVSELTNITTLQSLQCLGTSGNFILSFRNAESIAADVATVQIRDLKAVLQSMNTIGAVTLTVPSGYAEGSLLCALASASAPIVTIEFNTNFGQLPLLTQDTKSTIAGDSASKIYITEVRGYPTNETALQECSGHGVCSYSTGVCNCFPHWGTSDGLGNIGTLGDCGHQLVY